MTDRDNPPPRRILAYCHDSVGIGHLRRTLAICERIGRDHPGTSFLLATGTPYVQMLTQGHRVDYIKLPALEKASDGSYRSKLLGIDTEQIMNCRKELLLTTIRGYQPDLLLVDKAPLGVCKELVPALEWTKINRPSVPCVFGMRDIEDEPNITRQRWKRDGVYDALEQLYDRIWVYGSQAVFDVVRQYGLSTSVKAKLAYAGYIGRNSCRHAGAPRAESDSKTVVVTVGGGTDGATILRTYLEGAAAAVAATGHQSVIIGGPDLPQEDRDALKLTAQMMPGVSWLDFEPCMNCRIRSADLIVCMGGYNTLCELTSQGKPALVIPRTKPRLEQKMRAERWQERGLLRMLPDSEFTPDGLRAMTMSMLTESWMPRERLTLEGLDRVADEYRRLWNPADPSRSEGARASAVSM